MSEVLVYGDRIRQARILRRLTGQEMAARMGIPPSKLTRWEQADVVPMSELEVGRVARNLNFPAAFLTSYPTAPVADNDLLFRAPKSTLKREKAYLREFARFAGEVLRWIEAKRALPPLLAPNLPSNTPAVEAARETRRALGHGPEAPIKSLTHAIERAGVPIIRRPESGGEGSYEKHLGYTTWVGDFWDRPIIVVRGVPSWARTRWTVAHELGHTVLHRSEGVVTTDGETAEDAANSFANEILAPIAAVRVELPHVVTLFSLIDLKRKWGISLGALIRHLYNHSLINDQRFQTLRAQLYSRQNPHTGTTYGRREPGWDDREPEKPSMFRHWLLRTVGASDPTQVSAISGMWPADLMKELLAEQKTQAPTTRRNAATPSNPSIIVDLESRRK